MFYRNNDNGLCRMAVLKRLAVVLMCSMFMTSMAGCTGVEIGSGDVGQEVGADASEEVSTYATYEKFEAVKTGMLYGQVCDIMKSPGKLVSTTDLGMGSEYVIETYYWYAENGIWNATIMFQGGKVQSKNQIGLS